MKSLLDTHMIIWSLQEPDRISTHIKSFINQEDNVIYVSCLSFYEIDQKKRSGKLKFNHDWIDIISAGYFEVIDLKMDHILETRRLPLIHKDPFDRMIIAQSIVEGIPLITSDQKIQQYDFPYVKA